MMSLQSVLALSYVIAKITRKRIFFFLQIVLVLRCCCSLYFVLNSNPQWSHLCILFLELKLALVLRRFILRFLQNVKKKMERREKAIILAIFCEGEKKNKNRLEMSSSSKKIARLRAQNLKSN